MSMPTYQDFERYDDNITKLEFLIGIQMLTLFMFFALPILQKIDISIAFFLGGIMVLVILVLPTKIACRIIKSPWQTMESNL